MSKINKIKVNNTTYDIEDVNKPEVLILNQTINMSSPPTDANTLALVKNAIIKAYNNNIPLRIVISSLTYYAATYPSVVFDLIETDSNRIYVRTTNNVFSTSSNFSNFGIKYSNSSNFTMMFAVDATELANHALTDLYNIGTTTPINRLTISSGNPQFSAVYETSSLIGKDNTSSWTPTKNYGLVHKKYVDDLVNGISGGSESEFGIINNSGASGSANELIVKNLKKGVYILAGNQDNSSAFYYRWDNSSSLKQLQISNLGGKLMLFVNKEIDKMESNDIFGYLLGTYYWDNNNYYGQNGSLRVFVLNANITNNTLSLGEVIKFGAYTDIKLLVDSKQKLNQNYPVVIDGNYIIEQANSTMPTKNTQYVIKKYVDDKPTTYTGYDSSKTQVLKNINGTLTWVDE